MKTRSSHTFGKWLVAGVLLALPLTVQADQIKDFLKAFEKNGNYVQPFSTLFGTMTNSSWYQSAAVAKGFGFYVGIPISITRVADADRSFAGTYIDKGCKDYHTTNPTGTQKCTEVNHYTTPTLFGKKDAPLVWSYLTNSTKDAIVDSIHPFLLSDGLSAFSSLNWIPFGMPQVSFSWWNTELKLRYLGAPSIQGVSLQMPGIGIQHDLASFLPRFVPNLPVNISVAGNISWLSLDFAPPGAEYTGSMELNGFSHFLGIVVGYTHHGWVEAFMEAGWEGSSLESKGEVIVTKVGDPDETIRPNLNLEGRNTFRAALNVAVHFGYDAVFGQNVGSEFGQQISVLSYRYKK